MTEKTLENVNFAEIAREQGVTRATIHARVNRGWTEDEIRAGTRGTAKGSRVLKNYASQYSAKLGGFTSAEVAAHNNITLSGIYYRLRNNLAFELPKSAAEKIKKARKGAKK